MEKCEKEYKELYGDVPKDSLDRLSYLINSLNIKKNANTIFDRIKYISNIKWSKISFIIYLKPKATPRARYNGNTHIFYVKDAAINKKLFKKFAKKHNFQKIETPVKFKCVSYFPIPKSMNKIEQLLAELGFVRPITKPDWDNVGKTYSDMIQQDLLSDDSLIIEGISKKFYSSKPRVEIFIEYMDEHDSIYNETKVISKIRKKEGRN